ncbi:hemerythrin domain-containing protein [Undibacterium sp.]|jgi:pyridoxamine 5'-phosphate oxidase|uniref:hemerythrin domain-containing protein n=1 Tax=Undibacterium sp. TaxID=1914977 RepID=UPI002D028D7B|nr:hemerythrin domain-containing protein [Undibacterium sp.]HTD06169.1 hemerythrin domain-containing protein [Undibacterium sp.]
METLFASAPGFDQPLAVLKHCHDKIRKQLATLEKLPPHLAAYGADADAQQAANAIRRYFNQAAPLHHEDEEINLLPMLEVTARGDDATLLSELMPGILKEHLQMQTLWHSLDKQLESIAAGTSAALADDEVRQFCDMYTQHMLTEESHIAPMAKRLFSDAQMDKLGSAMQQRRGISAC